jgi:cleavage and polyadenylation specificity factor subunit 2
MGHNVLEYAQSQLEWMSEALTKDFYDGKANPFEMKKVKVATSVNQLERNFSGPKVVLATDASLTYGLSKEVLLKWGGDPRCRVIFTDFLDKSMSTMQQSLAAKLLDLSANPPIITSVDMPTRVDLSGQELIDYKQEQERIRRAKEEELQRKRRQEELSQV